MITFGGRYRIPSDRYHAVPGGWTAYEIQMMQSTLRGRFSLDVPGANDPQAPAWMQDGRGHGMYFATLSLVIQGLKAGDLGCAEIALRYIELRHISSGSGYFRASMAKAMRQQVHVLDTRQRRRLQEHFLLLLERGEHTHEFREYLKLWRSIATANTAAHLHKLAMTEERRAWLLRQLALVA